MKQREKRHFASDKKKEEMGVQSAGWSKARAVTQNSKLWPRRTFFPSAGEGESRRCDQLCCGTAANCHCRRKVRNYTLESWNGWKEGRKEGRKETWIRPDTLGGYTLIRSTLAALLSFSPRGAPLPLSEVFRRFRARIRDEYFAASI